MERFDPKAIRGRGRSIVYYLFFSYVLEALGRKNVTDHSGPDHSID